MPGRALIVAIERYPDSVDLAATIAGANAGAEAFFAWLTTSKGIAAGDVVVCAVGGSFPGARRFSTDREAIVDGIAALVAAGQDQTDELYVYYSGHGYCFQESLERRAIDVLVAGDYKQAAASGTKCLKLQEVQEKLYAILGGQHHYYFVDACRTLVGEDEIDPIGLGRMLGHAARRGRPTKYTLYSTAFGQPAAITSDFSPALIDGLHGHGRAKGVIPAGSLWVQFPLLCRYVQQRVTTQAMDQNQDGTGQGLILEIVPPPTYTCRIEVRGAAPADHLEARFGPIGNPAFAKVTPFDGATCTLSYAPGALELSVLEGGRPLVRIEPPESEPLDFFDDCTAVFERGAGAAAVAPSPPAAPVTSVTVAATPDLQADVVNLHTGDVRDLAAGNTLLPSGDYVVTVRERGMAVSRRMTTLAPGGTLDLGAGPLDPVRSSIVRAVGGDPARGVVDFSETLGPIGSRDLGLWLTLMGASHILRDPSTFSKLRELPLDDASRFAPGTCGVYVLAAGDAAPRVVGLGGSPAADMRPVPGLDRVRQATLPAAEGFQLVTVGFGASETRTVASYCLPNRLTFVVLSPGDRGQLRIHQFMLPMFHLRHLMPGSVDEQIRSTTRPLRVIRAAYLFQLQFENGHPIAPADPEDHDAWMRLLEGKWLDPVMSLLACYEIVRRGSEDDRRMVGTTVVGNLDTFFRGIPDTSAVAALLGQARPVPPGAPLFREGLLAFPEWESHLPLPAGALDYSYIWTTWRRRGR